MNFVIVSSCHRFFLLDFFKSVKYVLFKKFQKFVRGSPGHEIEAVFYLHRLKKKSASKLQVYVYLFLFFFHTGTLIFVS